MAVRKVTERRAGLAARRLLCRHLPEWISRKTVENELLYRATCSGPERIGVCSLAAMSSNVPARTRRTLWRPRTPSLAQSRKALKACIDIRSRARLFD